jgi:hypothetical protein
MTDTRQKPKRQLTFTRANHGVKVKRGFNEVFLTWKAIRELEKIRAPDSKPCKRKHAEKWIAKYLAIGPERFEDIERDAYANGIGRATLIRAKVALGVKSERRGRAWYWDMP